MDGDGMEEIFFARSWYYIDVLDADVQSPKYQVNTFNVHTLLMHDLDGDGAPELLYGGAQWGSVHALDASNGTELWSVRNPEHGTTRLGVADVDDDGADELMFGGGWTSTGEDFFFIVDVATRAFEWQSFDLVGPFAAMARGDVDDDGRDEIVAISWESNSGYADGVVHVFDATTYELEWRSSTNLFHGYAGTGVHDVAIGDVDGDGATEIVVATDRLYDGALYVINGVTHAVEKEYLYDSGSPIYAVAIADLDHDGAPELIAGGGRAHTGALGTFVYLIDGATGAVEWTSVSLGSYGSDVYALEVADLTGDGVLDVIASDDSLWVIDGATRAMRQSPQGGYRGLAVADRIYAGTSSGQVVSVDPDTLQSPVLGEVCPGNVWSVEAGTAASLVGSVQYACDEQLGIWGLEEARVLWTSDPVGTYVGYANNLLVSDHGDLATLVAGSRFGVVGYEGFGTENTDVDEDGVLNHLDNCPEVANGDQLDRDGDVVGDACDPYPDNPDNEQARCDEAIMNEGILTQELQLCRAEPRFLDADGDGEDDSTDACPGSPAGAAVDSAGCTRAQFCESIPVRGLRGIILCMRSDWGNDQPMSVIPGDCTWERAGDLACVENE